MKKDEIERQEEYNNTAGGTKEEEEEEKVIVPKIETLERPRFDPENPKLVEYLKEHGYVVVKSVASEKEVKSITTQMWTFLDDQIGAREGKPETWKRWSHIGSGFTGIISGVGQSEAVWTARCLPRVKKAFASIWNTEDLIVSFDRANIFRPWHRSKEAETMEKTGASWFHVDQGRLKKGMQCVQGLVSLTDANAETGGLCVIDKSHKSFETFVSKAARGDGDYVTCPKDDPILSSDRRILVTCKAGDLVLWDSRTIHCNTHAIERPTSSPTALLRCAVYVCMTPRKKASREVLLLRSRAALRGGSTSHWPHEFHPADFIGQSLLADALNKRNKMSESQREGWNALRLAEKLESEKEYAEAAKSYDRAYKAWPELETDTPSVAFAKANGPKKDVDTGLSEASRLAMEAFPKPKRDLIGYRPDLQSKIKRRVSGDENDDGRCALF